VNGRASSSVGRAASLKVPACCPQRVCPPVCAPRTRRLRHMAMFIPAAWTLNGKLLAAVALVAVIQQFWIYLAHRLSRKREELFRIITENAADMIALVNVKGRRLYNSPAYHKILGYSAAELAQTPVFEQIHPDDRCKVLEAAREARLTGIGKSLGISLVSQERLPADSRVNRQHHPQ